MVFHKTVEGLEWSLAECIKFALAEEGGLLSKDWVEDAVRNGIWCQVDDNWFVAKFKSLEERARSSAGFSVIRDHLAAVLCRRPAKRIWKWEAVLGREDEAFRLTRKLADAAVTRIVARRGIDPLRFHVKVRNFPLVNLGPDDFRGDLYSEEKARAVKILRRSGLSYLVEDKSLLIHTLSRLRNFAVSIYYLPAEGEAKCVRDEIRAEMHEELR